MSAIMTGLVWELPIQGGFGRPEKYILLAYADHADQNGTSIFPSIELISKKTGYEERSVQAVTRRLEEMGYLVPDGAGPRGTNRWRIPLHRMPDGGAKIAPLPIIEQPAGEPPDMAGGAIFAPVQPAAPEGIAPEEIAPEPSVVVKTKEEEGTGWKNIFSQELQEKLQQAGIYQKTWPEILVRLQEDWTEDDVKAVLNWMHQTNADMTRAAQRFVARIREGTKAPEQFYPLDLPEEPDQAPEDETEPDPGLAAADASIFWPVDGGSGYTPSQAWQTVLDQLRMEMSMANFYKWARDTIPVRWDGERLQVMARNSHTRDWLDDRLKPTATRLLKGILNRDLQIEFVAVDATETEPACQP